MGDPIEGECQFEDEDGERCGDPVDIGNPDWLQNITNLDRDELRYCDDHLEAMLAGVTIDLGAGVAHTQSEEFQEQDSGFEELG